MKARILILIVSITILILLASACGEAVTPVPPTPTPHPGQALVSSRCSTCHPIGLVENSKFSLQGWEVLVTRMVASGASLNGEQQKQVIDYLAATYPIE